MAQKQVPRSSTAAFSWSKSLVRTLSFWPSQPSHAGSETPTAGWIQHQRWKTLSHDTEKTGALRWNDLFTTYLFSGQKPISLDFKPQHFFQGTFVILLLSFIFLTAVPPFPTAEQDSLRIPCFILYPQNKCFGPVVHSFTKQTLLNTGTNKRCYGKSFNPQICLEKTAHTSQS